MKPEERVEAFIRDWHKCWLKQGNGSPPTPTMMMNMAFLMQWETAIAEIGVVHWIDSSGNSSGFSIPPEHDPEVEKVVTVAVNDDAAKVETKRKDDSFPKFTEYSLVRERDTWKISSKLDFYDEETASAFNAIDLESWLAKASESCNPPPSEAGDSPNCNILFKAGQVLKGDAMSAPAAVEIRRAGSISLPSGSLVVRDFSYSPEDARPLSLKVAPGEYEVEVAILENTIAAVRVLIDPSGQEPFFYRRAVTVDGDSSTIGVDAGNVCLCDARAFMSGTKRGHERDYNAWVNSTMRRTKRDDISSLKLNGSANPNAVVVGSGHGDGGYPAFWMFDTRGKPVALIVDFQIAAEFLTRKVRVQWTAGVSGIVLDETKSGGPRVRISVDDGVAVSGASVKIIRWLDRIGTVVGDNSSVGSWDSGKESGWYVELAKFTHSAVEMELEYYTGYRNGP